MHWGQNIPFIIVLLFISLHILVTLVCAMCLPQQCSSSDVRHSWLKCVNNAGSVFHVGLRTRTVFYGLRYVTVRAVTVTYGSLEQRFYGRFHTGRNRIRSTGYVPYTAAYGIRLFLS